MVLLLRVHSGEALRTTFAMWRSSLGGWRTLSMMAMKEKHTA